MLKTSEEIHARMDEIYSSSKEHEIPWNRESPPAILTELISSEIVLPCRAIDIGCGTGNYSIYLAEQGFDVTGVDVSQAAIETATAKSQGSPRQITFRVADMLGDIAELGTFGFINEWMILHHILPQYREKYLENVAALTESGGKYLSVSFSEADSNFGSPPHGKLRSSPMGPTIYCADIAELNDYFAPYFTVITSRITEIPGTRNNHTVNCLLLERV